MFTPLVVCGCEHFVGFDSDGLIHTHWDAICFQLRPSEFYLLNRACFLFDPQDNHDGGVAQDNQNDGMFFVQREGKRIRLWVAQVGFALPNDEFFLLRQMLHEAALQLGESVRDTMLALTHSEHQAKKSLPVIN